jgi:hypothetical protein
MNLLLLALSASAIVAPQGPRLAVTVDSSRHEVRIVLGPFHVPAMAPMPGHDMMMMDHAMAQDSPLDRFEWPVEGWVRGFRIALRDGHGSPIPRRVLHHLIVVNFGRRQLLYPAYERLLGAGAETDDVILPKTVGVPMQPGMPLGMYVGWHNETESDLDDVYLHATVLWTPRNQVPQPVSALPIYADVNLQIGGSNTFDVPPGTSRKSYEFTLPVGGRLLGLGGHLHDYGQELRLEDAASGRAVTRLAATRDAEGRVTGVERRLFGVSGEGLRLRANRTYRVVGVYDNPTGETRLHGAMASMAGLFVPDRLTAWPALEPDSPDLARDLAGLDVPARAADSMPSAGHEHQHTH